jgi:hypothetical protein
VQILEHPIVTYDKEERANHIRGFLISTKVSERTHLDPETGFSISKENGHERVKTFLGRPFSIIPESLDSAGGDGHFYGFTEDDLIKGYDNHAHGTINQLYGPFYYDDNSGDYWYDFGAKLFNSAAAQTLKDYGERMWTKFAVSPHIVRQEESPINQKNWKGIGVALVKRGAYGVQAVISKLCNGTKMQCAKTMSSAGAFCNCCKDTDNNIVKMINSHLSSAGSFNSNMNDNTTTGGTNIPPVTGTSADYNSNIRFNDQTTNNTPGLTVTVPDKPEQKTMTLKEYEELVALKTEKENLVKTVEQLESDRKTDVLNSIFSSENITDEATRKTLYDKYYGVKSIQEVNLIKSLYTDWTSHIVPTLKEQIKAELQKEVKTNTEPEKDEKKKNSAGSTQLRKEPKEDKKDEEKQSAGASINEAQLIHKAFFGGFE